MRVAIIPARGGSKRVPRKNIRDFCGRPMIAWALAAARSSGCFDRIVVSTDDGEVSAIAMAHGADDVIARPAELSDDHTPTLPVVRHALGQLAALGTRPDVACCIYATAAMLQGDDIRRGLDRLREAGAAFAYSVTAYDHPIQRALRITGHGRLEMIDPALVNTRSQDLEERFHDAGQFYWGTADAWFADVPILVADAVPVRLPNHRILDIDTPEDWHRAELMFQAQALARQSNKELHHEP